MTVDNKYRNFKFGFHSAIRVCNTKYTDTARKEKMVQHLLSEGYCIFKIVDRKQKKNYKFLNLRGLSTESFLAMAVPVQISYKKYVFF